MSVLDPDKTLRNLMKKGFHETGTKSSDHKQLEYYYNDRLVARTKISHHSGDLDKYLIKQMSVQCKLKKEQFIDLAKCPLSEDEYIKILDEQGYLI